MTYDRFGYLVEVQHGVAKPQPKAVEKDADLESRTSPVGLGRRCEHCKAGVPHHTNSETSIGGADRHMIYDIHAVEDTGGVGLAECLDAHLFDERLLP